ncbi:DUF3078 domain-containing protein [Bacteroides sp. 519]|uniref:DUF3078 domain-containing protein n=1 Tax=Bacteroides sp. 519 TaxID=2302937 RepID=UPI0013D5099A|nr:DUF3078 domain-containing protein [Bacteroides sp. 519]NDV60672.1 DUF3078 domain-containing protein [Bacteroides sp. 519]
MKIFWTLVFTLLISFPITAQKKTTNRVVKADTLSDTLSFAVREQMSDTLHTKLYYDVWASLDSLHNDTLPMRPITLRGEYYRLFLPFTYYYSPLQRHTYFPWRDEKLNMFKTVKRESLSVDTVSLAYPTLFERVGKTQEQIDEILLYTYKTNPKLIVQTEEQIMSKELVKVDIPQKEPSKNPIMKLFAPDKPDEKVEAAEVIIRKPNFWITGGSGSFQMSQNSVSDNWYQGGESTNSVLANIKLFANYNDKEKVQFESFLEAKAGFNSASSDTIRKYKVNTDLLRLYSKLGIQAASKWYYTISGEFNTQFFKNYKANSTEVVSSFLSPANVIVSVGMDYKLNEKKVVLSVFLSPLTYSLRYVGNKNVDETKFGLKEGDKTLQDFGSKLQTTLSWKIIPSITYDTRLYYFTSYKKVEAEWENSLNFVLNRYLSTKLFFHARFDDGAARKEDNSYFQFKEFLSFGINYSW